MCFMAMYMLMNAISNFEFARILEDLGYIVNVRDDVIEARRGNESLKVKIRGNTLSLESNDYGVKCLEDLAEIIDELEFKGLMPKLIVLKSPYIYSLEKKKGATRKLLESLGFDIKEIYDSYCG